MAGMEPVVVHVGDDRPSLQFQLTDEDGVIDLSDASTVITFKFRRCGTTTVLETVTCSKLAGGATGWVQMDWPAGALDDLTPGRYEGEISVSFDGSIQTANKYYMEGESDDYNGTLQIKVIEEF